MSCKRHDYELTGTCTDTSVLVVEVCARCGAERSGPIERRRFAAKLIDKAKKLVARGARGRQGRMFA